MPAKTAEQKAQKADYQRSHPGQSRAWKAANRQTVLVSDRWSRIKHLYKLTRQQYEEMVEAQGGACAGPDCVNPPEMVDHDHSCCPGRRSCGRCVRGIVCRSCNVRDALKGQGHHGS